MLLICLKGHRTLWPWVLWSDPLTSYGQKLAPNDKWALIDTAFCIVRLAVMETPPRSHPSPSYKDISPFLLLHRCHFLCSVYFVVFFAPLLLSCSPFIISFHFTTAPTMFFIGKKESKRYLKQSLPLRNPKRRNSV